MSEVKFLRRCRCGWSTMRRTRELAETDLAAHTMGCPDAIGSSHADRVRRARQALRAAGAEVAVCDTERHAELVDHGWSVDLRGWWRSPAPDDLAAYSLAEAWLAHLEVRDASPPG